MYSVKADGEFQALFVIECDAWHFRAERLKLFPDQEITIEYISTAHWTMTLRQLCCAKDNHENQDDTKST